MSPAAELTDSRLKSLEKHLEQENPVLLQTVQGFRDLDKVAYRMGLLDRKQSYAMQIPWWPLISVLGTFSAGKSTFINHYLGFKLQRSGNQAVDDRFTVMCYSQESTPHALPGVALDQDPRFPFYQISKDIELVAEGEGDRIDAYLQLRTCPSEELRGKILIDSPGFDADAQRTSTLRITDHIIHLSDLVLVFFDARHPEPGAMHDTLEHLVGNTIHRPDSGKFLYILNQLDTTAREDNPEEVVAAWQRALGEKGLTAGRFYTIYNPEAAVPIEDEALRRRFEGKRDADMAEIHGRMHQVEIERAYRIVGTLEKTARDIEERAVPFLQDAMERWRTRVLWGDAIAFGLIAALLATLWVKSGQTAGRWESIVANPTLGLGVLVAALVIAVAVHFGVRSLAARSLSGSIAREANETGVRGDLATAFQRCTRPWRSIFAKTPAGWGRGTRRRLHAIIERTDGFVQTLNDRFTNPSGQTPEPSRVETPAEPQPAAEVRA
jgi:GTPase SAR1 family protein